MGQPASELTPAGRAAGWDFACPDWALRLREGRSLIPDLPLDPVEAGRSVAIFDCLRLPDVPGQPAMAEAAGEWFRDILRAIFGSLDDQGARRVPELLALVPKKNSKTTNGAGLMLTALLMNRRPRAEFLLVGPTQEIADLAFRQAAGMIDADPEGFLPKRFHVQDHLKTIEDRRNKATLKIKTFDMKVMTGAKPAGVLIDELHIMSLSSHAARVIGQIRGGLLPNPEAFLVMITTQSDTPPAGVFRSELQYARGVRDGRIREGRMLPVLYEFPEDVQAAGEWHDPGIWPMVLPNLGRSINLHRLVQDYRTSVEKGAEEERRWASQHLNVEIGIALHSDRWRGADYWMEAADPTLTLEALIARSDVVTVGIDGGGMDDLLGFAVIGRETGTGRFLIWNHAWCDRGVLDLRKEIAQSLLDFEADGDLTFFDEGPEALTELCDILDRLARAGLFPKEHALGLDAAGMVSLQPALAARGYEPPQVAGIAQGYKLNGVILAIPRHLKDRGIVHSGSAMMAWCVGNAKTELRGNAVLITKQTSGTAKIDPLVATFNAYDLITRNPVASGKGISGYITSLAAERRATAS